MQENSDRGLPDIAAAFGQHLHERGLSVTPERSSRFATAVVVAEPQTIEQLYWVARATLVTSHEQIATFDRLFAYFFEGLVDIRERTAQMPDSPPDIEPTGSGDKPPDQSPHGTQRDSAPRSTSATPGESAEGESNTDQASALAALSAQERLNERPFSELTDAELELVRSLIERMPLVPPLRRGRRHKRNRHGSKWDVRATLRRAHRTGGDPVVQMRRSPVPKPRKIVLIADVSGSMEPYARTYLHLMRGSVTATTAEAFVFATRLTHVTKALRSTHTDQAYRDTAKAAPDWAGGTTMGAAINEFVRSYGRRGMARGSVIVIVSDGWETGDTGQLATAMKQLSRLAHHIVWVNPRKAAVEYQPLVGGMAAALPYVDTFLSGHSVNALEQVMAAISNASFRHGFSHTRL